MILILNLKPSIALGFGVSDQELDQAIRKYLSIYNNYQIDENIDESVVDSFTRLIGEYPYIFNYLARLETDPKVLPYLEKYSSLKLKFTGHPIDPDIKVTFMDKSYPFGEDIGKPVICDRFTRIIFLDPNFWQSQKGREKTREWALFHELGHCDLYRNHSSGGDSSFMLVSSAERLLLHNRNPTDLDTIFADLYKELFSERNTINHIECSMTRINDNGLEIKVIPDECVTTQSMAFQEFRDIGISNFQILVGSYPLRNYGKYSR